MIEKRWASDDAAVAQLAGRYKNAISAYFRRRVRDPAEVEDLTQDVFMSLSRRAEIETIENVEGYIFQVAANLLRIKARTQKRRPAIIHEGTADPNGRLVDEISPERVLLGRERWECFIDALHELPERARTIFILNRFEEMSGREIALRLGVSVSLVEKDMIKAIAHLKGRLP
jgi:RNA polymerase sigma factor (sigma-70 family)